MLHFQLSSLPTGGSDIDPASIDMITDNGYIP